MQWKNLVHFMAIGPILWPFGIFIGIFGIVTPVLVSCDKKNLAALNTRLS
jgi:hypothetical protein